MGNGGLFLFVSIYKEVEEITENWVKQFNEERLGESLGNLTSKEYLAVNQ
jgi:GTPase SAR1 family protein